MGISAIRNAPEAEVGRRIPVEGTLGEAIAGVLEAALFYDTGTVGPSISDLDTGDLVNSYGLTISMYLLNSHLMSFGIGRSDEATRFVFSTGDVW